MVHQFSSSLTNYSDSWPEPVNQEEHNSNVKMPNLDTTRRESIISQLLTLSLAERERRVRVCKRREKKKPRSEGLIALSDPLRDIQCDMYGALLVGFIKYGWKDLLNPEIFHFTQCSGVRSLWRSQKS